MTQIETKVNGRRHDHLSTHDTGILSVTKFLTSFLPGRRRYNHQPPRDYYLDDIFDVKPEDPLAPTVSIKSLVRHSLTKGEIPQVVEKRKKRQKKAYRSFKQEFERQRAANAQTTETRTPEQQEILDRVKQELQWIQDAREAARVRAELKTLMGPNRSHVGVDQDFEDVDDHLRRVRAITRK